MPGCLSTATHRPPRRIYYCSPRKASCLPLMCPSPAADLVLLGRIATGPVQGTALTRAAQSCIRCAFLSGHHHILKITHARHTQMPGRQGSWPNSKCDTQQLRKHMQSMPSSSARYRPVLAQLRSSRQSPNRWLTMPATCSHGARCQWSFASLRFGLPDALMVRNIL